MTSPASRHRSVSLCDALDQLLDTGVVAMGEATISVAKVEMIYLGLRLVLGSVDSVHGTEAEQLARYRRQLGLPEDFGPGPEAGFASDPSLAASPGSRLGGHQKAAAKPKAAPGTTLPPLPGKDEDAGVPREEKLKNGLAQLVLTLLKLLHELLERQAIRRIEGGNLSDEEIERLGQTLQRQSEQIEELRETFGLKPGELNVDLGPLGKILDD